MLDTKESAEQEKSRHRALLASIVEGLRVVVESDEQLLAFARGRLAGGWRGKLTIGPEAFFAPYVNIGLTDRRFLLQHIHPEDGKPSEILPHAFPLTEILSIHFAEVETFGKDLAGRLAIHLNNEQHCRIRLQGAGNVENARALVEVFRSLTVAKRAATSPTQSICAHCGHILDQPSKFCPYCGGRRVEPEATPNAAEPALPVETTATAPIEEPIAPEFAEAVPPDLETSTEIENPSAMALEEDPELADEIHRFTEEGGSPSAVEHDDDVPLEDAGTPAAAPQTSDSSAPSAPPDLEAPTETEIENPPPSSDAPPTHSYDTTF